MVFSNEKIEYHFNNYMNVLASYFVDRLVRNGRHRSQSFRKEGLMPDISHSSSISRAMPDLSEISENPELSASFTHDISRYDNETILSLNPAADKGQIGTATFDLRIGRLVAESDTVVERIKKEDLLQIPHKILEKDEEFVFDYDSEGGKVYYVTSFEQISFSKDLEFIIDSKSTTGRVGCMSHGVGMTDDKELITIIQPFAFPLKVRCGKTKLSQVAVRYENTPYMTNEELLKSGELKFNWDKFNLSDFLNPKGLAMLFDTELVYRAKKCDEPIDMDANGTLDWKKYFDMINNNEHIIADKKTLYLLGSLGVLDLGRVCGILSREQDVLTGTGAWGHFAGIFQPFWKGGVTMEYYSFSKRKILKGDRAGVVKFDKVDGNIRKPEGYGGSYQGQKPPRLPKMFSED